MIRLPPVVISAREKVAALRRAIADGTYDTPERMSGALDNFLNQIG